MIRAALLLLALASISRLHADEGADRAALREIKTAYEEAINTNDLAKITPFLGANFTGVMVTGDSVRGLAELEAYWKKIQGMIGKGGSYSVRVTPGEVHFNGDLAICTGAAEELVQSQGQQFPYTSVWTTICRRDGASWKLERIQATMDPINNVFVRARMRGAGIQYGAGGFIMGCIVTALLLIGFRRSRAATKR